MKKILITCLIILLYIDTNAQHEIHPVRMDATTDFPVLERAGDASNRKPYGPYHVEEDLGALAGDDLNFTFHMAAAEGSFPGNAGTYSICLNTLTERDGECVYNVYVNDERVGQFQKNPPTNEFTAPATLTWMGVNVPEGARIRVESNNWSNLNRHEDNFFEYARGRWTSVDFIPVKNSGTALGSAANIGIFDGLDSGETNGIKNMAEYDVTEEAYYLTASAGKMSVKKEDRTFLWKSAGENFELEAHVRLIGPGKGQTGGILITWRAGSESEFLLIGIQPDGSSFFSGNGKTGSVQEKNPFTVSGADRIELVKKEDSVILSAARSGEEYERRSYRMPEDVEQIRAGIFVNDSDSGCKSYARFDQVRFFTYR